MNLNPFVCLWKVVGKLKLSKFLYRKSRGLFLKTHLVEHSGRQKFSIGQLKKDSNKKALESYLISQDFEKDAYAWIDDGEILSMRRLDEEEYQYHLRLFKDGEVRGHYEYAPDRHPLRHYWSKGLANRKKDFRKILTNFLI